MDIIKICKFYPFTSLPSQAQASIRVCADSDTGLGRRQAASSQEAGSTALFKKIEVENQLIRC